MTGLFEKQSVLCWGSDMSEWAPVEMLRSGNKVDWPKDDGSYFDMSWQASREAMWTEELL